MRRIEVMPDAGGAVLTEARGPVLVVTINRPDVRNAVNTEVAQGLLAAVRQLDDDPALAVAVVTGSGPGFCSGMDAAAFAAEGLPRGLGTFYAHGAQKPLLCAVEGFALAGGLELAMACDVIVAAKDAVFSLPEVRMGLFAAGGGPIRLVRHLPLGAAMAFALTGETITAEQAHEHGLVTQLCEPGRALDTALALADRMAVNEPLSLIATKRLIREAQGRTEAEYWDLQRPLVKSMFGSDAAKGSVRESVSQRKSAPPPT